MSAAEYRFGPSILDGKKVLFAQGIQRLHRTFMVQVPEGPAIAAWRALHGLADTVDRSGNLLAFQRSVHADNRLPAFFAVKQDGTGLQIARFYQGAKGYARRRTACLHGFQQTLIQWQGRLNPFQSHFAVITFTLTT